MIGRILLADLAALTLFAVVVLGRYLLEEHIARKRAREHLRQDRLLGLRGHTDYLRFVREHTMPLDADQRGLVREWLTFLAERGPTQEPTPR